MYSIISVPVVIDDDESNTSTGSSGGHWPVVETNPGTWTNSGMLKLNLCPCSDLAGWYA